MILAVATRVVVYYRSISRQQLSRLFKIDNFAERKQQLWNESESHAVIASNQIEATLQVTEPESWGQLEKQL